MSVQITRPRREGVRLASEDMFAVPAPRPDEEGHDWFLTASQRGNPRSLVRPWTDGNGVRAHVDGRSYFAALADAIDGAGPGDLVLLAGWRGDLDERLRDDGTTVAEVLEGAAGRDVTVKGLLWRSHGARLGFSAEQNRALAVAVNRAGGEILLDQRVRALGSHHQKFVVVRHAERPADDVVFLGGIDLAHGRRDDREHRGDPQGHPFAKWYGLHPAWHDVQVELRGAAVRDVENVFRERWDDPADLAGGARPAQPDVAGQAADGAGDLPAPRADSPDAGGCAVQLLRTYPVRRPAYPFAPDGDRSAARGYAKALRRARRLVYVEDQYLWSSDVARVFSDALRREPGLHLVAVVPRFPRHESHLTLPAIRLGHAQAMEMVREAGGDRVQVLDVENAEGWPIYVHAKVCVVDDVWATVGSDNFNRRSWTHDSELTAAVLDHRLDGREPRDPAGLGDGARAFARSLRLELWREHLGRDDDAGLIDPAEAVAAVRGSAAALDGWYAGGCQGPRPPGRLREHPVQHPPRWQRFLASPAYRTVLDPDGRPSRMRLLGHH